jgi:predicted RNA-binding Zn ribbon-like protein
MPEFKLIAGDPALDLVNTISWRGDADRTIERLTDPEALAAWAIRAGLAAEHLDADEQALADVRTLRDALHGYLTDGATEPLRAGFTDAIARAALAPGPPLEWRLEVRTARDLAPALALRALRLLQSPDGERIGTCSDPACGWVFLDRTRNRSRRWCSSTDCGNRDRASRHYARHRAT